MMGLLLRTCHAALEYEASCEAAYDACLHPGTELYNKQWFRIPWKYRSRKLWWANNNEGNYTNHNHMPGTAQSKKKKKKQKMLSYIYHKQPYWCITLLPNCFSVLIMYFTLTMHIKAVYLKSVNWKNLDLKNSTDTLSVLCTHCNCQCLRSWRDDRYMLVILSK